MKNKRPCLILLLVQLILPVCWLAGWAKGLSLEIRLPWVVFAVLSAVCLWLAGRIWKGERRGLCRLALALTVLNCLFTVAFLREAAAIPYVLALLVVSVVLFLRCPKGWISWLFQGIAVLEGSLLCLFLPIFLFGMAMNQTRVLQKVESPDGRFAASVVESDQGALGGDTTVYIREREKTVELLIGQLVSDRVLYRGDWYEGQEMTIFWENHHTLLVNSKKYYVNQENFELFYPILDDLHVILPCGTVECYTETHGGFQGEGITYAAIRFPADTVTDEDFMYISGWNPGAVPEELMTALNCGLFPEDGMVPAGEMEWYYFRDRHPNAEVPYDVSPLNQRYSRNFTAALYDAEENVLYYFVADT